LEKEGNFVKLLITTFDKRSNNYLLGMAFRYAMRKATVSNHNQKMKASPMLYKKHSSRRCPGIANQNHGQVSGKFWRKKIRKQHSKKFIFIRLVIKFVADSDPNLDPY
jgi:hypothetical protein